MTVVDFGQPQHVGMVVDDLDAATAAWGAFAGVEWQLYPHVKMDWLKNGRTIPVELSVAYSTGSPAVELLQEHSIEPLLPAPDGHHIGYLVDDMTAAGAELVAAGMTVHSQLFKDSRELAAYYTNPHGLLVEISVPGVASILLG